MLLYVYCFGKSSIKRKILGFIAALCIVTAVVCVALPKRASDVLSSNISTSAKSVEEHVAFLNAHGYQVTEKPVQIQEIVIPEEFSAEYEKYNEMQKLSGFDLSNSKATASRNILIKSQITKRRRTRWSPMSLFITIRLSAGIFRLLRWAGLFTVL